MLSRDSEQLEEALRHLSPDDRALLELSLLQGVTVDEVATLLRVSPEEVRDRREDALEQLAEHSGKDRAELAALFAGDDDRATRAAAERATAANGDRRTVEEAPPRRDAPPEPAPQGHTPPEGPPPEAPVAGRGVSEPRPHVEAAIPPEAPVAAPRHPAESAAFMDAGATAAPPRSRRARLAGSLRRLALGIALIVAVIVAVVASTSGGGEEPELGNFNPPPPERKPAAAPPAENRAPGKADAPDARTREANQSAADRRRQAERRLQAERRRETRDRRWEADRRDAQVTKAKPPPAKPKAAPKPRRPAPRPAPAGPTVALVTVRAGSRVRGSARIVGGRLELRPARLPRGTYTIWLYDSVVDARPLARFRASARRISARLPKGYRRFGWIDVSREPADGNPNHSGESLLRVRLSKLAR